MIPYLFPILGGVAGIGFTGVAVGSYWSENSSEKLDWLDIGLSEIKNKQDFQNGIAVKIEDSSKTLSCDESWKKKNINGSHDGEACSSVSEALNKVERYLENRDSEDFTEVVKKVHDIDRDHSYCSVFPWNPLQMSDDIGLKDVTRLLLETNCFNLPNEDKSKTFKEFLTKVDSANVDVKQENQLVGGIITGYLANAVSGWAETIVDGNSQIKGWNNIANGFLKDDKSREVFKLKAKPKAGKGWAWIKLEKKS